MPYSLESSCATQTKLFSFQLQLDTSIFLILHYDAPPLPVPPPLPHANPAANCFGGAVFTQGLCVASVQCRCWWLSSLCYHTKKKQMLMHLSPIPKGCSSSLETKQKLGKRPGSVLTDRIKCTINTLTTTTHEIQDRHAIWPVLRRFQAYIR